MNESKIGISRKQVEESKVELINFDSYSAKYKEFIVKTLAVMYIAYSNNRYTYYEEYTNNN